VERQPPRVLITGRLAYSLSAFGEHLIGEELEAAVDAAAQQMGRQRGEFAVAAVFPTRPADKGGHSFVVECEPPMDDPAARSFAAALDRSLAEQNADYRDHRPAMRPPSVTAATPGSFAAWMRARGKAGGQNKVPRVIGDQSLFASLLAFMRDQGHVTGRSE
jgi:GH3 auxin-responsive promoter